MRYALGVESFDIDLSGKSSVEQFMSSLKNNTRNLQKKRSPPHSTNVGGHSTPTKKGAATVGCEQATEQHKNHDAYSE